MSLISPKSVLNALDHDDQIEPRLKRLQMISEKSSTMNALNHDDQIESRLMCYQMISEKTSTLGVAYFSKGSYGLDKPMLRRTQPGPSTLAEVVSALWARRKLVLASRAPSTIVTARKQL